MSTRWKVLLILVAVVCFAIALSYPIGYRIEMAQHSEGMARLTALREAGLRAAQTALDDGMPDDGTPGDGTPDENAPDVAAPGESAAPDGGTPGDGTPDENAPDVAAPGESDLPDDGTPGDGTPGDGMPDGNAPDTAAPDGALRTPSAAPSPAPSAVPTDGSTPAPTPTPSPTPVPTPTPDRRARSGALSYPEKEHVVFDEADILPEYRELYAVNSDFIGWITIPGTPIDYPVVQSGDSEFYLKHDFFGEKNINGQIILDQKCDPFTPSYNLVVSGHNMYNENMFGPLLRYKRRDYWESRKTLTFDVLTEKRQYVVFAAFFSADYDQDEEGFRYNADIQYRVDAERWLSEIRENQLYDTEIDARFGDEFLTLTTCNRVYRKNGRFVLVCRRIREGEVF